MLLTAAMLKVAMCEPTLFWESPQTQLVHVAHLQQDVCGRYSIITLSDRVCMLLTAGIGDSWSDSSGVPSGLKHRRMSETVKFSLSMSVHGLGMTMLLKVMSGVFNLFSLCL